MKKPPHKGSRRKDYRLSLISNPFLNLHSNNGALFDDKIFNRSLFDLKIRCVFQDIFHLSLIGEFIGLRARGPNGRAFCGVKHAKMNSSAICHLSHDSAKGIDLTDNMSLCGSPDGGVTAHFSDGVEIHGEQEGMRAHTGSSMRSFAAGMSSTNNNHIKVIRISPHD